MPNSLNSIENSRSADGMARKVVVVVVVVVGGDLGLLSAALGVGAFSDVAW